MERVFIAKCDLEFLYAYIVPEYSQSSGRASFGTKWTLHFKQCR